MGRGFTSIQGTVISLWIPAFIYGLFTVVRAERVALGVRLSVSDVWVGQRPMSLYHTIKFIAVVERRGFSPNF